MNLQYYQANWIFGRHSRPNVQFGGTRPLFIDLLSIRRYREGEYWLAHNQFCEQFLNPLLLSRVSGYRATTGSEGGTREFRPALSHKYCLRIGSSHFG
jgi:hypothetical protein